MVAERKSGCTEGSIFFVTWMTIPRQAHTDILARVLWPAFVTQQN